MRCAWKEFLSILPADIRQEVDRLGSETLQELRLRTGKPPELVTSNGSRWLCRATTKQDLGYVVNTASRYSPWAASTVRSGYITAPGGHRIGICGEAVIHDGQVQGVRDAASLCIRVARDFPGIADKINDTTGNILIIGAPGSGKTTLLRDLIRSISNHAAGCVAVVDERGELFPMCQEGYCFESGRRTDILTGCKKATGLDMVLRTMGPYCIALDEITAQEDCQALVNAGWCGVRLLATAHASDAADLRNRPVYRLIWENKLFDTVVVLRRDKSWYTERIAV